MPHKIFCKYFSQFSSKLLVPLSCTTDSHNNFPKLDALCISPTSITLTHSLLSTLSLYQASILPVLWHLTMHTLKILTGYSPVLSPLFLRNFAAIPFTPALSHFVYYKSFITTSIFKKQFKHNFRPAYHFFPNTPHLLLSHLTHLNGFRIFTQYLFHLCASYHFLICILCHFHFFSFFYHYSLLNKTFFFIHDCSFPH